MSLYAQNLVVFDGKEEKFGGGWSNPENSVTLGITAERVYFEEPPPEGTVIIVK